MRLDRCEICSLIGERAADELFGCTIPAGIDMDQLGDQMLVEGIVRDKRKCANCLMRDNH